MKPSVRATAASPFAAPSIPSTSWLKAVLSDMMPSSCAALAASLGTDSRVTDHQGGLRPLPRKTGVSNSEAHAAPRQQKTAAAKIWARMLLRYTGQAQKAPQPLRCGEAQASLCTADPSFPCVHSVSANHARGPRESARRKQKPSMPRKDACYSSARASTWIRVVLQRYRKLSRR